MPDSSTKIEAIVTWVSEGADKVKSDAESVQASTEKMAQSSSVYMDDFAKQFNGLTSASDGAAQGISADLDIVSSSYGDLLQVSEHTSDGIVTSYTAIAESSGKAAGASSDLSGAMSISDESANRAAREFLGLDEATKKSAESTKKAGQAHQEHASLSLMDVMAAMQIAQMIGQVIAAMDKEYEAIRNLSTAFTTLTGSADKAAAAMNNLQQSAAARDFGTVNIGNAEKHLMMLGISADEAQKEVERVAEGIASVGGSASQVEPVVMELQKIKSESRVTTEEMNQLVAQGLPAWQLLADGMGVSVKRAQQEVASGAITGTKAFDTMMNQLSMDTGNTEAQSHSLSAEWNRLGENMSKAFGPVLDHLAKMIEGLNSLLEKTDALNDSFKQFGGTLAFVGQLLSGMTGTVGFSTLGHAEGIIDSPVGHFATVGERGPETMFIPQGASIFPNGSNPLDALSSGSSSALPSFAGAMANMTVNITHVITLDSRVIAQQTIPHIAPLVRGLTGSRM
jgi:tape measure domain-containing protein